jgi:beta-lactamase superfamily II metal-dependent hydrolase
MSIEDHIANIQAILKHLKAINIAIEKSGQNEAFDYILTRVQKWEEYVKKAMERAELNGSPHEFLLSVQKLKDLITQLEKQRTYEKFKI